MGRQAPPPGPVPPRDPAAGLRGAWRAPAARLAFFLALGFIALLPGARQAFAQDWPARPVRFVVTFTQGGGADLTARIIGDRLGELWRQQVVVENRGGGNGSIGVEAVLHAPADGYTFLLLANTHVINMALYPRLAYDLLRDFTPVGMVSSAPMLLAVNPRFKAANLAEFTAVLRERPGKVDVASCGIATSHHFAMEIYKHSTGTVAVHVPHRGCSPATIDAVSGQIEAVMTSLPAALPFVRQGKLRALGVTTRDRSPNAPDIPTFRESGVPELRNYAVDNYYGLMARAGTPAEIVARLGADLRRVMAQPELRARLAGAGLDPFPLGPEETVALIRADVEKFREAIRVANIQPE